MREKNWEEDNAAWPNETPDGEHQAYHIRNYDGIAWNVYGWETKPDEETEWTGQRIRTGKVICVMVGDDRRFAIDPKDISPLKREEFCGICGQIGCCHDGR